MYIYTYHICIECIRLFHSTHLMIMMMVIWEKTRTGRKFVTKKEKKREREREPNQKYVVIALYYYYYGHYWADTSSTKVTTGQTHKRTKFRFVFDVVDAARRGSEERPSKIKLPVYVCAALCAYVYVFFCLVKEITQLELVFVFVLIFSCILNHYYHHRWHYYYDY